MLKSGNESEGGGGESKQENIYQSNSEIYSPYEK